MKYQPVIPPDLFNMFIEKLGYMPEGKDILVIRDIYTACFLAINNDVTFVSDDQEAISAFINTVIINDDFKGENNYIHIDTKINTAWLKWIEENMEFDIILENPPYGKSLPFVITNELLKHIKQDGKIVYIGPIGKIQSLTEATKLTDSINEHCDEYIIIDDFNSIFDISLAETCGMLVLSETIKPKKYRFNNLKTIYSKIASCKSIRSVCIHDKRPFSLPMRGDNGYAKGYHLKPVEIHTQSKTATAQIDFNSLEEQTNYIQSLNCWPYKIMYILDDNAAVPAHMPWMSDYTQPWSDKRFCEYFEITGYIDDEHAEPGSEWEIILKTIEENK